MRTLTKPERNVLSCVPASTRVAFSRSQAVKAEAASAHDYKPVTIEAVWQRLLESELIEERVGFCRRTLDGDLVLDAVPGEPQQPIPILPAMEGVSA